MTAGFSERLPCVRNDVADYQKVHVLILMIIFMRLDFQINDQLIIIHNLISSSLVGKQACFGPSEQCFCF